MKEVPLVAAPLGVVTVILPVVAPAGTVAVILVSELTANDVAAVPLNLTAVAPVKPFPLRVTTAPTLAFAGEKDDTAGKTRNDVELVDVPIAVVTLIGPLVAPVGTVALICASEVTAKFAVFPLNFTDFVPVKPLPLIVTCAPSTALGGENEAIDSGLTTVNGTKLVPVPPGEVTEMFPVDAADGTVVVIFVEETIVNGDAVVPLNFTAVAPVKPVPLMVTAVPTAPLVGENELMTGVAPPEEPGCCRHVPVELSYSSWRK